MEPRASSSLGEFCNTESHTAPALGFVRQALSLQLRLASSLPSSCLRLSSAGLECPWNTQVFVFHQESEAVHLPPGFASTLAKWETPALLGTVVPRETLCAVPLS